MDPRKIWDAANSKKEKGSFDGGKHSKEIKKALLDSGDLLVPFNGVHGGAIKGGG